MGLKGPTVRLKGRQSVSVNGTCLSVWLIELENFPEHSIAYFRWVLPIPRVDELIELSTTAMISRGRRR